MALALLFITAAANSFAGIPERVEEIVLTAFNKQFSKAQEIKWETNIAFDRAIFTMDGERFSAWYEHSGELYAFLRDIEPAQLPIKLMLTLEKAAEGFTIVELAEVVFTDYSNYYVSIENAQYKIILEAGNDHWGVFSKIKKP